MGSARGAIHPPPTGMSPVRGMPCAGVQAEEDEYAYTLMELQQLYHHCKELLATATQQKVEALLQVAKAEAGSLTAQSQSQPQTQHSSAAPAGESVMSAFATPPVSPSLQRPKGAGPAPGSAASSTASTGGLGGPAAATQDAPHQGPAEPAALDTATAAAVGNDTGQQPQPQPEPQLPVSTLGAMPDGSMHGAVPGSDRLAGVQHAEQSALPAAQGLAQLLLLAHHYLTLLQQLPPADVAAAAQGGGSSKGRAGGRRAAGGPAAGEDALKRLAAASQDLDRDRQQLLSSSQLKQQQLDDLVAKLLDQSAALGAGVAAAGAGQGQPGSQSTAGHSSPAGGRGALKKLLRAAHGGSPAATAAASAGGAGAGSGAGPSSGSSDSLNLAGLISRIAAGCASDAHAPQQLLSCPDVAGVSAADLSGLQLALCHEVQLLAEVGLAALRYIPKVTAITSLVHGAW